MNQPTRKRLFAEIRSAGQREFPLLKRLRPQKPPSFTRMGSKTPYPSSNESSLLSRLQETRPKYHSWKITAITTGKTMCPGRSLALPCPTCTPWASINKSYKQASTEATLLLQNLPASEEHQSLPSHHSCGGVNIVIMLLSVSTQRQ